jgi:hypothetical protein
MLRNLIEIQLYIEEKRLIWGKKLENFLAQNSELFLGFVQKNAKKFANSQYFLSISCLFIIFVSIFLQSRRDIGYESAFQIEAAKQIIAGKNGSSFLDYLSVIPVYFAQIFDLNSIILTQIFVNLLGFLSLFCCYKILGKKFNLVIIGFCVGYFLRVYTLQFNEFATASTWLLAFLLPYISCQFFEKKSKKIKILEFILSILIIALNSYFIIFIAFFWLRNFVKKNILFYVFALIFSLLFIQEFLINSLKTFEAIKFDIFPIALFLLLFKDNLKDKKILLIAVFCAQIISLLHIFGEYDGRFLIYALFFQLLFLMLKDGFGFVKKDFLWLFPLVILFQFDAQNIAKIALNLCCFWWITLFFQKKLRLDLIILTLVSLALFYFDNQGKIAWIFCAFAVLYLVKFKIIKSYKFMAALLFSYFLSLIFAAIFNHQNLYAYNLKTPSQISDAKMEIINKYAKDDKAKILMISDDKKDFFPVFLYANKNSNFEALNLKDAIKNNKNTLIFSKKNYYSSNSCDISLLEISLRNSEFANIFTKNYRFLTEIYQLYPVKRNNFKTNKINEIEVVDDKIKLDEFEIYVRK